MINKNGAVGIGTFLIVVLIIGVVGAGIYLLVSQVILAPEVEEEILVTGDCASEPTLQFSVLDAINPGSAVITTGNRTIINGQLYGPASIPSTLAYGDVGTTLYGLGSYLNSTVEWGPLKCGVNPVSAQIYATDAGTLKVFNDEGNVVTDLITCLGSVNQSESSTTIQNEVKITSVSDQSLGDIIVVVQAHNTSEVDDILLSDGAHTSVTSVPVPELHASESSWAGGIMKAFRITADNYLKDGMGDTYTLSLTVESGQAIGADDGENISITMYTMQWFVDVDGTFKYGIEDSNGGLEYEDTFDYDYCITDQS